MPAACIHQRFAARTVQQLHRVPLFSPVLIWVRHGSKRLSADGSKLLECHAGHALVLPAGETPLMQNLPSPPQGYLAELFTPPQSWTRRFEQHYLPATTLPSARMTPFVCDEEISQQLLMLITQLAQNTPLSLTRAELLWHGILLTLAARGQGGALMQTEPTSLSARCRQRLEQDLGHPWHAAELAAELAISESTLRRQLRDEQTHFSTLLSELRLACAFTRLMTETTPVLVIALECGFQSPSRFSSNVRRRFGMSPTEIRRSRGLEDDGGIVS